MLKFNQLEEKAKKIFERKGIRASLYFNYCNDKGKYVLYIEHFDDNENLRLLRSLFFKNKKSINNYLDTLVLYVGHESLEVFE